LFASLTNVWQFFRRRAECLRRWIGDQIVDTRVADRIHRRFNCGLRRFLLIGRLDAIAFDHFKASTILTSTTAKLCALALTLACTVAG
jgi:hypothetical protein